MVDERIELSRRTLLGGIATMGAAGAATGAGTIAVWSDEVELGGGTDATVSTGDVDVGESTAFTLRGPADRPLAPGDAVEGTAVVEYTGSLAADLYVDLSLAESGDEPDDTDDRSAEAFAARIELQSDDEPEPRNRIEHYAADAESGQPTDAGSDGESLYVDDLTASDDAGDYGDVSAETLADLATELSAYADTDGTPYIGGGRLTAGDRVAIEVLGRVPQRIPGAFENESLEVTLTVTARQHANSS